MENTPIIIQITCIECGKTYDIQVNKEDYERWQNGELIQNAFPYLTPGTRELFLSKICESCFDKLFGVEETEEGGNEYDS